MFYNAIIETKDKDKRGNQIRYYDLDNNSLEDIKRFIVYPFLKKEEVFIDGRYISAADIKMIQIKEAEQTTMVLRDRAQSRVPQNVFVVYGRTDILTDEYTNDISKSVLSNAADEITTHEKVRIDNTIEKTTLAQDKVFIVHGRDDHAKTEVARFIEQLDLTAIILHEQNNNGKTIMEKIEEHTNVGYGIVLYTPCDRGSFKDDEKLSPRARQNVVFEHGYLIGKLGRNKVSALVKSDVETPGDINGIVYITLDQAGAWKQQIAQELISVGFSIDFNKILRK